MRGVFDVDDLHEMGELELMGPIPNHTITAIGDNSGSKDQAVDGGLREVKPLVMTGFVVRCIDRLYRDALVVSKVKSPFRIICTEHRVHADVFLNTIAIHVHARAKAPVSPVRFSAVLEFCNERLVRLQIESTTPVCYCAQCLGKRSSMYRNPLLASSK